MVNYKEIHQEYIKVLYHKNVYERSLLCSPKLHLFDQKYSEKL